MKKSFLISFSVLLILIIAGCRNQSASKERVPEVSSEKCLIGTWAYVEDNFEKSFTFNSDKTGSEIYAEDGSRPFTWVLVGNKPTIVYIGENNQWSFTLNCSTKELSIFSMVYKKK